MAVGAPDVGGGVGGGVLGAGRARVQRVEFLVVSAAAGCNDKTISAWLVDSAVSRLLFCYTTPPTPTPRRLFAPVALAGSLRLWRPACLDDAVGTPYIRLAADA